MKVIKKLVLKYGSAFATLAMMVGISSSTKACWFWYNQPKVPEGIKSSQTRTKMKCRLGVFSLFKKRRIIYENQRHTYVQCVFINQNNHLQCQNQLKNSRKTSK